MGKLGMPTTTMLWPSRVVNVVVATGLMILLLASSSSVVVRAASPITNPSPPDCGGDGGRYRALVCWLYNSRLALPDARFEAGPFTISVTNVICTDFRVASMRSSSSSSSSSSPPAASPSVSLDLVGMSATCSGKYDLGGIWGSGDVVASVGGEDDSPPPALSLRVDLISGPLGNDAEDEEAGAASLPFPISAIVSNCMPNLLVDDVSFSGSISSHLIGLFSGPISSMVTAAMNDDLCKPIKEDGESWLNSALRSAREYLGGLILNNITHYSVGHVVIGKNPGEDVVGGEAFAVSERRRRATTTTTTTRGSSRGRRIGRSLTTTDDGGSWDEDMPFLKRVLLGINDFVSRHLNEGIILEFLRKLSTWQSTSTSVDCEGCGFFFRGLNGLVDSLTGGGASLEINVPEKFLNFRHNLTIDVPRYGEIILTARSLRISGIDNFTELSLFYPSGRNTLSSSIASDEGFNFSMLFDLEVRPANGSVFEGDTLNETFELHFNTSNVNFESSSSWEFDEEIFSKLSVGSFIYGSYTMFENNRNPLNCVLEALRSATILDLQTRLTLDAIHVSPSPPASFYTISLEDNIDDLINCVIQLLLLEYPETSTEALSGIVQVPLRNIINDGMENLLTDTKMMPLHCVNVDKPKNKPERPLRFDSNKAIMLLNQIVNADSTIGVVNEFIRCVVNNAVETKQLFVGHFFNFSIGELDIVVHDLHVENLDSVYDLKLLEPEIDHYHMTNTLGYGTCDSADHSCNKTTSFSFGMNLVHSTLGNLGNVNFRIGMQNLKLQGGTDLRFDMNYLPLLSIADLLAHPQCVSVPITNFDFYGFNATVDMLEVNIDASLSGEHISPHSFTYKTVDSSELATAVSALMANGANLMQQALGDNFLMQLNEASVVCDTPANPRRSIDATRSTGAAVLWTLLIILVFITFNTWLFLRPVKSDYQEGIVVNSDDGEIQEGMVVNSGEGEAQPDEQQRLNEPLLDNHDGMDENFEVDTPLRKFPLTSSTSLMCHPSIHPGLKWGVPAVLALAFILFLSSNLSIGASVDLLLTRADGSKITPVINIYAFSLGSTISEMAKAGVYLLMLLIVFCSGVWPYMKLVLMVASWVTSTRRLPPVRREKILYLLDALGKFSLIDAYVLVLMMVAFRYNLEFEGVGALNVYVTPKYGFYSFLFATIISLVSGHAVLFLHRRTMIPSIPVYSGRRESLSRHVFDDKRGRGLVRLSKRFRRTILAALFCTFVLICVGVSLKSFHFKFSGAAGTALGDDRIRSFSLVTIGEHIPHSVQDSSSFGIHWIQMSYFFFALVMPIMCLMSMVALFLAPMTLKQQQKVFMIAEVTNAWSAIEVFVIAIVASLIEISPFAESMVGEHCSLLNQILSGWSVGTGDNDLHYCFDVKSSIDGSATVLIIGVILNSFLVSSLHRFAHHALWERVEREDRPDATELENKTVRECVLAHTFISQLRKRPRLGRFMFEEVSFGPNSEYDLEFEDVIENEDPHVSNDFWSEWRKIVSVI